MAAIYVAALISSPTQLCNQLIMLLLTIFMVTGQCDANYVIIFCKTLIMSERLFEMCQVKPYFVKNTEWQRFGLSSVPQQGLINGKSDYSINIDITEV